MNRNLNWLGKTGFGLSLVPILTFICFWFIQPGWDKLLGVKLIIFGSPIALIVSLVPLKLCTKRKWAVSGVIIGGIETLIIFITFMCALLFFEYPAH
jgi:hypothetical protein